MLQRIREVMGYNQTKDAFNGICEMDEIYVGGKADNRHLDRRIKAKGVYEKSVYLVCWKEAVA